MRFAKNVLSLCKIAIPDWKSAEVFHLVVLSILLVLRTSLTISISEINGAIVRGIISRDFKAFLYAIGGLAVLSIPASICNSGLDYLQNKLAIMYRERLSKFFNSQYLSGLTYY